MSGKAENKSLVSSVIRGTAVFYIVFLLLLSVLAALTQRGSIHEGLTTAALCAVLLVSSLTGSLMAVGRRQQNRLLIALIPALGLILPAVLGRWLVPDRERSGQSLLLFVIAALLPAVLVGIGKSGRKRRR